MFELDLFEATSNQIKDYFKNTFGCRHGCELWNCTHDESAYLDLIDLDTINQIITKLRLGFNAGLKYVTIRYDIYSKKQCKLVAKHFVFKLGWRCWDTQNIVTHKKSKEYEEQFWCYQFDNENEYGYCGYCGCDSLSKYKHKYKTVKHVDTRYDSDHDEDFHHHLYRVTSENIIGIIFENPCISKIASIDNVNSGHIKHYGQFCTEYKKNPPKYALLCDPKQMKSIERTLFKIRSCPIFNKVTIQCYPDSDGSKRVTAKSLFTHDDTRIYSGMKNYEDPCSDKVKIYRLLSEYPIYQDHVTYEENVMEYRKYIKCSEFGKGTCGCASMPRYKRIRQTRTDNDTHYYEVVYDRIVSVTFCKKSRE